MARFRLLLSFASVVLACGPGTTFPGVDAGLPIFDAGVTSIAEDSGIALADSGVGDRFDGGLGLDASVVEPDAGPLDAGDIRPMDDAGVSLDAGNSAQILNDIQSTAVASACYRYQWKDRGQMPKGYIKGLALVFARQVCNLMRADVKLVSAAQTSDSARDALAWYASEFSAKNLDNSRAGVDTLRHTYTLLLGLGMRESSGEHCTGRDLSAANFTSDSSEAGAWQTSWDSHTINVELPKLFNQYKTENRGCFLSAFAQGVTCTAANWRNWGTGADGLRFQQLEKECPGFAAEYAAVMLRVQGGSAGHYGPLRTKAAEVRVECDVLLQQVEAMVMKHPQVCADL
jgi:hypothetical protein